jgi:eukaryotic-like serine/threonine-protein kinase
MARRGDENVRALNIGVDDSLAVRRLQCAGDFNRRCAALRPGSAGRRWKVKSDYPATSGLYRDHVIMWSKEFRRTLDYVETRKDLDAGKIAYYGLRWSAAMGAIMPADESRIKAVLLESGELFREDAAGSRSDQFRAIETSQNPLLRLFGAPEKDKRHVLEDGRHVLAPYFPAKEGLAWLDRYLGPVAQ